MNGPLSGQPIAYTAIANSQRERMLKDSEQSRLLKSLNQDEIKPRSGRWILKPRFGTIFEFLGSAGENTLHWLRFMSAQPKDKLC